MTQVYARLCWYSLYLREHFPQGPLERPALQVLLCTGFAHQQLSPSTQLACDRPSSDSPVAWV